MARDAEVALFRHVKDIQLGIVINGVAAGILDIHRCT